MKSHAEMMQALEVQSAEFSAVHALAKAIKALPQVVDDAYPEQRHYYESAVRGLINAFKNNGRLEHVALSVQDTKGVQGKSVVQEWATVLPMMQQTVLIEMVRGPDTVEKYHISKYLLRWYRRCLLYSALDGRVLTNPWEAVGGSFTGPSFNVDLHWMQFLMDQNRSVDAFQQEEKDKWLSEFDWRPSMDEVVAAYLRGLDALPIHAVLHFMQAVEIMGYNHPDTLIRDWWSSVYIRLVHNFHLWPETKGQLDSRLGDTREGWLARGDKATLA